MSWEIEKKKGKGYYENWFLCDGIIIYFIKLFGGNFWVGRDNIKNYGKVWIIKGNI